MTTTIHRPPDPDTRPSPVHLPARGTNRAQFRTASSINERLNSDDFTRTALLCLVRDDRADLEALRELAVYAEGFAATIRGFATHPEMCSDRARDALVAWGVRLAARVRQVAA